MLISPGAVGKIGNPHPSNTGVGTVILPRALAWAHGFSNESSGLGASNVQVGATTHHVWYEPPQDGSFQVWWYNGGCTNGTGEWNNGAVATMAASVKWIDADGVQHLTTLQAANGDGNVVVGAGGIGKLFGPAITNPKVGSHFWINFYGLFPTFGGYYSHSQADYANGESLRYGASVTSLVGSATAYTNTNGSNGDYYGPIFVGGLGSRPTVYVDGDSIESGVLGGSGRADVPNTLHGVSGLWKRKLAPYVAGIDVSVPGMQAQERVNDTKPHAVRDLLATLCQYRAAGQGSNDIMTQGRSAAQFLADEATLEARIGLPSRLRTITPKVNSAADNTTINSGRDTVRQSVNTTLRALGGTTFDVATYAQDGSDASKFRSLAMTVEGTHLTNVAGAQAIIANTSYDVPGNFGDPDPVSAGFQYATGPAYQSLGLADSWSSQQAPLTLNNGYSPEHKLTAALIVEDTTASSSHRVFKNPITLAVAGTTRTFTFFAKRVTGTRNVQLIVAQAGFAQQLRAGFDLATGALLYQTAPTANLSFSGTVPAAVLDDDAEFWKITAPIVFGASTPANPIPFIGMLSGSNEAYSGDGASSIAVWGMDVR